MSGTSKKMEMKLTNMARASLEELRLDHEDLLRQRGGKEKIRAAGCSSEQEGGFTGRLY